MTTVVVILIGAGLVLIASALDNSSIQATFTKIINGNSINWSGQNTETTGPEKSATGF